MGEFGITVFNYEKAKFGQFWIRKGNYLGKGGNYLCCHKYGCYGSMVGREGKAAMGGCTEVVIKSPILCHL